MKFFSMNGGQNRVFGLDILRFIAIFMVLIGHSKMFLPIQYKPIFDDILFDGVAIFFVLSGYLIGGILIKLLEKEKPSLGALVHFWKRRWMRTLPAYLFVLIFLLIYTFFLIPKNFPSDWYKYFLFIQNFINERNEFFAESWSLSIEEWFYLTIPVLLFGALFLFKSKVRNTVALVSILVLIAITFYRYKTYHSYGFDGNLNHIKGFKDFIRCNLEFQVIPRLDAIMFGMIGAFVAYYFPKIWNNKFNILFAIVGGYLLFYCKRNMGPSYQEFAVVWYPLYKSLAVLMMLPFLSNWKKGFGFWTSWVTFFSLISYSMYLVNLNIVSKVLIKNLIHGNWKGKSVADFTWEERYLNDVDNYTRWKHIVGGHWVMDYALFWVLTIVISFLMYKLIEIPFMNLRDKKKKFGAHT